MKFHHAQLENGLTLIGELNPHAQSVAVGFFVRTGARDESPALSGVSHFLEHMAFKGDARRSADDVNRIFDEVGADYNAYTSEEVTLYHAAILPEYLPTTFDLLAGLLYPSLRAEDFAMEKNVILEEIGMYEDMPAFVAFDHAMQLHFGRHPLGLSILGTRASVGALTADQMRQYHDEHYRAGNVILAVAGNTDWPQVTDLAARFCGAWPAGRIDRPKDEARPLGGMKVVTRPQSQQEHLIQMAAAPPAESELRIAAELLSVVVGDDSGSRLYWELVDPGDAEAADLAYNEYEGSGTWLTGLSCDPESVAGNLERIAAIYDDVNRHGITAAELEQARNKVAARVVLRSERPMGRLSSLGGNWVYRQEYRSVADDLQLVKSVTLADIRRLLDHYPLAHDTIAAVGPLSTLNGT